MLRGGPITGEKVVPCCWRNSPQSGPMLLAKLTSRWPHAAGGRHGVSRTVHRQDIDPCALAIRRRWDLEWALWNILQRWGYPNSVLEPLTRDIGTSPACQFRGSRTARAVSLVNYVLTIRLRLEFREAKRGRSDLLSVWAVSSPRPCPESDDPTRVEGDQGLRSEGNSTGVIALFVRGARHSHESRMRWRGFGSPAALARQQIRGSGSPTSMSTIRVPPNAVTRTTMPGGSDRIRPITAASRPTG